MTNGEMDRQKIQEEILRANAGLIGANYIKGNFGEEGKNIFEDFMSGEDITKIRKERYDYERKLAKQNGIYEDPSQPTNYDLIKNAKGMSDSALANLTLGNLEKIIKGISPELKFEVPKTLKDYVTEDVLKKIKGGVKVEDLSDKEKDILESYDIFSGAYEKGCGVALYKSFYLKKENDSAKRIEEKYNPKPKK